MRPTIKPEKIERNQQAFLSHVPDVCQTESEEKLCSDIKKKEP
jgi:hypothetical protein